MRITVEPRDGHELDRLVTALLNATGVVRQVIETIERGPDADGVVIIRLAAERVRDLLTILAEHRSDEQLALVSQVLGETTLLVARALGLEECLDGGE